MDKEEAIRILENPPMAFDEKMWQALQIAIESLSAEPTDLISRADVLALAEKGYIISNSNYKKVCDLINELPSAYTQTSGDLISRADAIKAIESRQTEQWIDADVDYNNGLESAVAEIKALPSADRPSGSWVENLERNDMMHWSSYSGYCTNCGEHSEYLTRYCGECGAVMYALNSWGDVVGGGKMGGNK